MAEREERYIVRPRFWPLWLWIMLPFQGVMVGLLVWGLVMQMQSGDRTIPPVVFLIYGTISALFGLVALPLATLARRRGQAELTVAGIRPRLAAWEADRCYSWNEVAVVRVVWVPLLGRRLYITTEDRTTFFIPYRPADADGFREAVESFAGPDHPLTRAVWTTEGYGG